MCDSHTNHTLFCLTCSMRAVKFPFVMAVQEKMTRREQADRRKKIAARYYELGEEADTFAVGSEFGVTSQTVKNAIREYPPTKLPTSQVDQGPAEPATAP